MESREKNLPVTDDKADHKGTRISRRAALAGAFCAIGAPAVVRGRGDLLGRDRTLNEIIGQHRGDPAEKLNAAFREIAPTRHAMRGSAGTIRCQSPLILVDKLALELDANCHIERGFSGGALVCNPDLSQNVNDWRIRGGTFQPVDQSQTGGLFRMYGDRWSMRNMVLREWQGGVAIGFGGNDIVMDRIDAQTGARAYGNGVFRCVGGQGGHFTNLLGVGGDDVFQFVPVTQSSSVLYDRSIRDMHYQTCRGASHSARLIAVAIAGPQDEQNMTCSLKNLSFTDVSGSGGQRSVVIENSEGTTQSRIDDILIQNCTINAATEMGRQNQSIVITSYSGSGGIGRVVLDRVSLLGSRVVGLTADGVDSLELTDCHIGGEQGAMHIARQRYVGKLYMRRVRLSGGYGTRNLVLGGRRASVGVVDLDAWTRASAR